MKILVLTQYFWPESFKINDLCIGLKEKGHEVTVLTGKPNYPKGSFYEGYSFFGKNVEEWEGIKIYRAGLIPRGKGGGFRLLLNFFSFAFFASIKVWFINEKFDRIFVYMPSPVTVGLPAIVAKAKFKAPIYFWVQDLWPESLRAAGGIKNKVVLNFFNRLTIFIYKNCKVILIQSEAFRNYIVKQRVPSKKIVYYPNSTETFYNVLPKDEQLNNKLPDGFKIMFAGNIGESQSFDTLITAGKILQSKNIPVRWIILGDGRIRKEVEAKVQALKLDSVFYFLGAHPATEMPKYFSCADALVVSLKKHDIFALTIPSKVQSYLAVGKPIIGSLDGEGARIIQVAKAGYTAPAEDADELANSIAAFYELSVQERLQMGSNARHYFEQEFEREKLLDKLERILIS